MTLRLIGDEMMSWSDLDGRHGPGPVRKAALGPLLGRSRGRTLIAGPHHPDLIDAVPAGKLTLLVRGVPDAEVLATRYAVRPGVEVCCGGLGKLATEPGFDTVIALDGLTRLSSAEGPQLGWTDLLGRLLAVLRPDGRLLLSAENAVGLHRLVELPAQPTDSDWVVNGAHDPTLPAGLAGVLDHLTSRGIAVTGAYAAFPNPTEPVAVLGSDILTDQSVRGFVEAVLAQACRSTQDALRDPARLAITAVRHAAATALAPAWIVLGRRGTGVPAAPAPPDAWVDLGGRRCEVRRDVSGRWLRHTLDGGQVAAGPAEAVPRGRTLEDLLVTACAWRDLPAVRGLLDAWQASTAAGVPADRVVIDADGRHTALAPALGPPHALRALASTMLEGAAAHSWPLPTDVDELAWALAAMAGVELATDAFAALPAPPDRPGARALREAVAERDRLARDLSEVTAKAAWFEATLAARDDALQRALHTIGLLSGSGPARLGRAFVGGVRAARATARRGRRRIRPSG